MNIGTFGGFEVGANALGDIASKTAVSDDDANALEGTAAFQQNRAPRFNWCLVGQ